MNHDPNGPSTAGRRQCPASMTLEARAIAQGLDLDDKEDADRGTVLHEIVAHKRDYEEAGDEKWIVDRCWKYMAEKIPGEPGFGPKWIEQEVTLPLMLERMSCGPDPYHEWEEVTHGTLDTLYLDPERIIVIDYKMHRSDPDEESIAWQQKTYAAMAIQKWREVALEKGWPMTEHPVAKVYVYFPRTGLELYATFDDDQAIAREYDEMLRCAAENPEDYRPTVGRCQYCRGKAICPAFKAEMAGIANLDDLTEFGVVPLRMLRDWYFEWKPKAAIIAKLDRSMTEALKKRSPEELASIGLELVEKKRGGYTAKASSWMELRKKGTRDESVPTE